MDQSTKKKSIITLWIVIAIAIVVFMGITISNNIEMGRRQVFDSIEDMRSKMQGKYIHVWSVRDYVQYEIKGDNIIDISANSVFKGEIWDIEWHPKEGEFTIIYNDGSKGEVIVLKNGDIERFNGTVYEKGKPVPRPTLPPESGYEALRFSEIYLSTDSVYSVCTGKITNNGRRTYSFVKVKGVFEDSAHNVLDTDWTYAVGSEGLAPKESKSFRLSVPRDMKIDYVKVSVMDFDD